MEPSGEYYDYTKTMKPERPWMLQWHQKYVYRIMHAMRGGTGMESGDPVMAANRPPDQRYVFGDGKINYLYLTFEDALKVIRRMHEITCGVPQIVLLTGWQYEGHDSKYPAWGEVNKHLKRPQDATALDSLRWLIREARKYNCLATLHINMFDAYPDSPLFQEYVEKDIIAKDKNGKPIIGNRWWGMDCYHVSYTQEWKHGLAQKRIDDLIAMVPEIQENHCLYLDAFLGARKADLKGPISPYLGFDKETEARTQRRIFRYWRDRGIDCASEYVWGMRADRFVGLQPHTAAQGDQIADLPDELYCSNPAHVGFTSIMEPESFVERFWLEYLPWFNKNNAQAAMIRADMIDGRDICMPVLWCDKPTMVAFSKIGCKNKTWKLASGWEGVTQVKVSPLPSGGEEARVNVAGGVMTLSLKSGVAYKVVSA